MSLERRTPMKRGKPLARGTTELKRTELKRGTTPIPKVGRKGKADAVSLRRARPLVEDRSGGWCEFRIRPVCTGEAQHIHHRQTGHANHHPDALAHICFACHTAAHLDPDRYEKGWLVKHPADPATIAWVVG